MPTEPALELGTGVLIHERKRKARVGHRLATGTAAPCARGRGREAEARGAGHGGTHISSHRCVVARAAPPSPWLPPRAASNAVSNRGVSRPMCDVGLLSTRLAPRTFSFMKLLLYLCTTLSVGARGTPPHTHHPRHRDGQSNVVKRVSRGTGCVVEVRVARPPAGSQRSGKG